MKLTFLGATGTVTGSKYLIETPENKVLVDCGLFQGYKELRLRNRAAFPIDPKTINAIILTHAHIDHSGYIPALVKNGFNGKIYCTEATRDLCAILLPDSGYLQEEEARYANYKGFSKHHPAEPLYTRVDAEYSLEFFHPLEFDRDYAINDELEFRFNYNGHILGASFVLVRDESSSILFSGDVGRPNDPIMRPPIAPLKADYLVVESTYGDRLHEQVDPLDAIEEIVNRTVKRGGSIIIPAFAVGRAQLLLYYLYQLKQNHRIPEVPVFLDSPMAIDATKLFYRHSHEHRLSKSESMDVCQSAKYIHSVEESIKIDQTGMPVIIISASGMATGGRVLHHLKVFAADSRNSILFTGFQAGGTRGDRMLKGEREIKIHGSMIPVRAEIQLLNNTSAHADYQEMINWLEALPNHPRKVFITHGEQEAAKSFKQKLEDKFGWGCDLPIYLQQEEL